MTTAGGAPPGVRLQKYLSRAGVASRREAERLMLAGRVTVNGEVVDELGTRVDPERDVVLLDGVRVTRAETMWRALHKPAGALCTRSDPHGGTTVYDVLPEEARGLAYVGRLDRGTEGLLLFTNDGDAANALLHPSGEVEREYLAVVKGRLGPPEIDGLLRGVELEDGLARAARAERVKSEGKTTTLRLVLLEGRKREVRRMLMAVGHPVLQLVRTRFGPIELGDLAAGATRRLEPAESRALADLVRAISLRSS